MHVWKFIAFTVVLFHAACLVSSPASTMVGRPFDPWNSSRISNFSAILTMDGAWHHKNNRCLSSVRQGFYLWEIQKNFEPAKRTPAVRNHLGLEAGSHTRFTGGKKLRRGKAVAGTV